MEPIYLSLGVAAFCTYWYFSFKLMKKNPVVIPKTTFGKTLFFFGWWMAFGIYHALTFGEKMLDQYEKQRPRHI